MKTESLTKPTLKIEVGAIIRLKSQGAAHHSIWKVVGIHYGASLQENLVSITRLDLNPGDAYGKVQKESIVPMAILGTHAGLENA